MNHILGWSKETHYMSLGGQCGQSCPCCRSIVEPTNFGVCPICRLHQISQQLEYLLLYNHNTNKEGYLNLDLILSQIPYTNISQIKTISQHSNKFILKSPSRYLRGYQNGRGFMIKKK